MKKEIILRILESLEAKSKLLNADELELDKEHYGEILEIMLGANLIANIKVTRGGIGNKVVMIPTNNPRITLTGIEYLESNKENGNGEFRITKC